MSLYEPTELRYWNRDKSFAGYTLFATGGTAFLIDMEGNLVHKWQSGNNPHLLENGNLMTIVREEEGGGLQGLRELDWDGNIIWEYRETREGYTTRGDPVRIFNKKLKQYTTVSYAIKSISNKEAIAAGYDPSNGPWQGASMDVIFEVDMGGKVIWEWRFMDHLIQDFDPTKANYVGKGQTIADYPGRLNINMPGKPLHRDWLHCNSMDFSEELDQVVINSVRGEFYVIDHDHTFIPGDPEGSMRLASGPAGDFLYRFGDPAQYGQGDPPSILRDWNESTPGHKQIGGSHNIQWIRPGLPGAGHFLVFNNAQYLFERTPQSYIFEINGYLDANGKNTGSYVNPPAAGYYTWEPSEARFTHKQPKRMSNQIVWIYTSKNNTSFFSHIGSGCQRLPNGNTLICAMTDGIFFEVTSDGELAWEYINPVSTQGEILEALLDRPPMTNASFRALRYGPDHPALAGRDLTPRGTITGKKGFQIIK